MPFLSRITSTFFVSLINRLGVRPPPPDGFELVNTVQPVSLVDSDIVLSAQVTTQLLNTPFTAGELVAQAALTVMADTGALAAGNYNIHIFIGSNGAAGMDFNITRRNAANAADVWSQYFGIPSGSNEVYDFRIVLLEGERLRVTNQAAVGVGVRNQASIWAQVVT